MDTYSTYDAKSQFSEILRKVRAGRRIVVTHHGRPVAEIRPLEAEPENLATRLIQLERDGVVEKAGGVGDESVRAERRPGALARFLASRE